MIPSDFFLCRVPNHTYIVSHVLSVTRPERKILNRAALPEKHILVPSIDKVR